MTARAFRAVGTRVVAARPAWLEREAEDLSTWTERRDSAVDAEAVSIAPPPEEWPELPGPIPGRSIEGALPGDEEARFLLRLPRDWNGGLVVCAAPGLLSERSLDVYWSDACLARGYAFACTDKGARLCVSGERVFIPLAPENRMERWYPRLKALALLAQGETRKRYGRSPERTYAVGLSNGGYLVRCALERDPQLFDGGVDVSGPLWTVEGPTLLDQLSGALRACRGGSPEPSALARLGFGLGPDSGELFGAYRFYWDLVLACAVGDLDAGYAGPLEDYRPEERAAALRSALAPLALTGRLERPLLSLAGELDLLVPAGPHARGYRTLVEAQGRQALHELTVVAGAGHVDRDRVGHPWLRSLMPGAHAAFDRLRLRESAAAR